MKTRLWKGERIPIHLSESDHRWAPIRKGYPTMICRCGETRARSVAIGSNTVVCSPAGGDVIRSVPGATASVQGDIAVRSSDGRMTAKVEQIATALLTRMETIGDRKFCLIRNQFQTTTLQAIGINTPSVNGTPTVNASGVGEYVDYTTAAVANSDGGWSSLGGATTGIQPDFQPCLVTAIRTGAVITNIRFWIGLFTGTPMASDTIPANSAGYRFSTSAGDLNWQAVSSDGVSSQVTDTGIAVAASTSYILVVIFQPAAVIFSIRSSNSVFSNTVRVPAAGNNLLFNLQARTLNAVAKDINISHMWLTLLPGFVS